jgi:Xaa-Pro aminopeptidase
LLFYKLPQIVLEEGMVLTVEPGVYFNPTSLQLAQDNTNVSAFLNWTTVDRFRNLGGVRIEDTLLVTSQGLNKKRLKG